MIIPSAANFRLRFPEFTNESDAEIEFAIEEAARQVDDTWTVGDQANAVLYLSGHYVMVSIARRESATGQRVTRESLGDMSWSFENTRPAADDLESTQYGQRYRALLRRNFSGGLIV
jgi:hypothetical protein